MKFVRHLFSNLMNGFIIYRICLLTRSISAFIWHSCCFALRHFITSLGFIVDNLFHLLITGGFLVVIADYVQPEEDQELAIAQAEAEKARLMADAERVILPLERAIKLGIATSDEAIKLELWELYTVKLNRVDPSKPVWPEKP
nr:tail fiber assembly protein [Citrobacter amalonaticus]